MITVWHNDVSAQVAEALLLTRFLIDCGYALDVYAVAVNGVFLPKESHATYVLKDQDRIDILSPMQGG